MRGVHGLVLGLVLGLRCVIRGQFRPFTLHATLSPVDRLGLKKVAGLSEGVAGAEGVAGGAAAAVAAIATAIAAAAVAAVATAIAAAAVAAVAIAIAAAVATVSETLDAGIYEAHAVTSDCRRKQCARHRNEGELPRPKASPHLGPAHTQHLKHEERICSGKSAGAAIAMAARPKLGRS